MDITFLGATGTVTGSKYLVTSGSTRVLVDCGLFQGFKQLRLRNWAPLPVEPAAIDAVILTHAHIDHSGYLPRLVKGGFAGRVFCTAGTRDLCEILLPDAGYLQEEEARNANRHGYSKHRPALPLYTEEEARRALPRLTPVDYDDEQSLGNGLRLRFLPAGHIVGAAIVRVSDSESSLVFSGDLGRPHDPVMVAPAAIREADYLVLESTYGDRRHESSDPTVALANIINRTVQRGGVVLIPAFAVGRAQSLLYCLHVLKKTKAIPDVPVFLNSPMAVDATGIFCRHLGEHRLGQGECRQACAVARYVTTVEESKALNRRQGPMIVIAASGMATGGRVLHHLRAFAPDPNSTILFAGYQAGGTRGAAMVDGAEAIKIHGEYVPVRAEVVQLDGFSAHADYTEILHWLTHFENPPRQTFITHGEPAAADALRQRIEEQLGWCCQVPEYRQRVTLA
jgi:metallo-beta-lactamase family protein